jgi:hypothetical protein
MLVLASPDRHAKLDRVARCPVLQRAAAGLTAAGLVAALHTKGGQIAQVWIRDENDVASRPTVAAVGATLGDVLLTAEVQAPVAASARLDVDLSSIVEHTRTLAPRPKSRLYTPSDWKSPPDHR